MRWFQTIAIIIVIIAALPACSSSEDNSSVAIIVQKITLNEVSFDQNNICTTFKISNNNETSVTLEKIEYNIYLGHSDKWMHISLGEKGTQEIEADSTIDLSSTTIIEKKKLSETITDKILGAEPSIIKVDGSAWFTVGAESFEIKFSREDDDPYRQMIEDEDNETSTVEVGTDVAKNE